MSKEKEQEKQQFNELPDWLEEYLDLLYIDKQGIWRYEDLPDEFADWKNYVFHWMLWSLALSPVHGIFSLADADLLNQHILPRYRDELLHSVTNIVHKIAKEYAAIKKQPCEICKTACVVDRSLNICTECKTQYAGEGQLVKIHIYRARKAGCESTLTIAEWIATLNRFNWKCAYCQEKPYEVLEHYIPITRNGGTTQENCVPACRSCNASKGGKHPELDARQAHKHGESGAR